MMHGDSRSKVAKAVRAAQEKYMRAASVAMRTGDDAERVQAEAADARIAAILRAHRDEAAR